MKERISEERPSSRFWELEKMVRQDKRRAGVSVEMSRPKMSMNILALLGEGDQLYEVKG